MKLNKNKNLVSYSRNLAEARYSLSLVEQKLIWAMTSLISPQDDGFKTYRVEIKHLAEYIGIDKKSALRELDKVTDSLMERVLRIPIDEGNRLLKVHWVSHCILDKKHIEFSFHQNMQPYLLKLKEHFTSHRYRILVSFRSSYTIRIYQLLKIYEYKGSYKCSLEDLRTILDVGDSYKAFKEFRRNVINPAKKEFETKNKEAGSYQSDISFDLETIRTGRVITHLNFIIKKQSYQDQLSLDFPEPEEKLPAVIALKKYGITEILAKEFIEDQGEEDILRCVILYENYLKSGTVKNKSGGYLLKMLQAKAGKQTEADKQAELEAVKKQADEAEKTKLENREKQKNKLAKAFRKQEISRFLSEQSEAEKTELLRQAKQENPLAKSLSDPIVIVFITSKIPNYEKLKTAYIKENLR